MKRSSKESSQKLYEIAEAQQGFFTTKQALTAGYAENTHPYHVNAGNWIREHRGIYRLANFPIFDESELVLWSLWSRNRQGIPQAVYSHETALDLHDLSDLMPSKLHITVPLNFRRGSGIPEVLILHRAQLPEIDIEIRQGFRVTTALRTIVDLLKEGTVTMDIIKQALREAVGRGIITRSAIRRTGISPAVREKIEGLIQEINK